MIPKSGAGTPSVGAPSWDTSSAVRNPGEKRKVSKIKIWLKAAKQELSKAVDITKAR